MARLSRVFEDDNSVASLWYLHGCDPKRVESDLDVPKLKQFSRRLKTPRDTTFSHMDKMTVGDPDRPYREAAITYPEIQDAAESVWRTLARLQRETFQNVPNEKFDQPLRDLIEMYASELTAIPTR